MTSLALHHGMPRVPQPVLRSNQWQVAVGSRGWPFGGVGLDAVPLAAARPRLRTTGATRLPSLDLFAGSRHFHEPPKPKPVRRASHRVAPWHATACVVDAVFFGDAFELDGRLRTGGECGAEPLAGFFERGTTLGRLRGGADDLFGGHHDRLVAPVDGRHRRLAVRCNVRRIDSPLFDSALGTI